MDIVPAMLRTKALAVLAETARDTEYIRTPTAGGGYVCSDCEGGPGAHITAGLFGIKWFLMALVSDYDNSLRALALHSNCKFIAVCVCRPMGD